MNVVEKNRNLFYLEERFVNGGRKGELSRVRAGRRVLVTKWKCPRIEVIEQGLGEGCLTATSEEHPSDL